MTSPPPVLPAPGPDASPRTVRSVCPYCAVGCGLLVEVADGVADKVRADPDHPANLGRICAKGVTLPQMLRTSNRLLHPQVRESIDQPFRRVSWDEALDFVARRLRAIVADAGPDATAFYGSGQLPTEDYYLLGKLAKAFIGTNNQDTNSRLCMTSAAAAYAQAFGYDGPPASHADIEDADCFLVLGSNMADCHPVLFQRMRARKNADPERVKVIVIDPRRTATAAGADLFLAVRPGADVALVNAMLHVIVAEGLADEDYIAAHTEGFDALREEVLARYAPEQVAAETGIDAELIRLAARTYGTASAALSMWAMGANQSSAGVDKNLALINLALATGNVGRPGAGPFSLTGQPNAMGGREAGGMAQTLPGHRSVADPEHRKEMERFWGVAAGAISSRPGLTAVETVDALLDGRVQALWVMCTNPVASLPDGPRTREAIGRARLVVVQDAYHPTETGEYAHVLLPAAQWSEREAIMTNGERRVCFLEKAGDPPGEALPDWEIICRFAARMGYGEYFDYADSRAVFAEFLQTTEGRDLDMSGIDVADLEGGRGVQWPAPRGRSEGSRHLYADGAFPTPTGRARFRVVTQRPPAEAPDGEYPFVLLTGRIRNQWHTMTRTGAIPKLADNSRPYLEIHPADAGALGLASGQPVEVSSRRGRATLPARYSFNVKPGTVFAPFHWGLLWSDGAGAINDVTSPAFDPVSKEPELKYSAVKLVPRSPRRRPAPLRPR